MSRAFVRESDHSDDDPPLNRQQLPLGIKNLITPAGAQRLQAQLEDLLETKRRLSFSKDGVISHADEPEKRKLETRIRVLQQILESIVITHPQATNRDRVCFGAKVLLRDTNGEETKYRIVGVDETDLERGHISWRSPLARALLSRSAGKLVQFQSPSGMEQLEIVSVDYDE